MQPRGDRGAVHERRVGPGLVSIVFTIIDGPTLTSAALLVNR